MHPETDFPRPFGAFERPIPLPTTDPDETPRWCVSFNEDYLPAVLGCLLQLTLQSTWDTTNLAANLTAQQQAMTLIRMFQEGTDCEAILELRACQAEGICGIEWSTDGITWNCIELNGCIADIVALGIDTAIQNGQIQGGEGQPSPGPRPEIGVCHTYHVRLTANSQWHCPSVMTDGDTIHVTNVKGGWTDGSALWFCPDGSRYVLGECRGSGLTHEANDPEPSAYHMAVVGYYGSSVYFDPLTGIFTIPNGTGDTDVILQANDGTLADNGGEVTFDVEVCNADWCFEYDFASGNGAWTTWSGNGTAYTSPYWLGGSGGGISTHCEVDIEKTYSSTRIDRIEADVETTVSVSSQNMRCTVYDGTTQVFRADLLPALGSHTYVYDVGFPSTKIQFALNSSSNTGQCRLHKVRIFGAGACPFGTPNCP